MNAWIQEAQKPPHPRVRTKPQVPDAETVKTAVDSPTRYFGEQTVRLRAARSAQQVDAAGGRCAAALVLAPAREACVEMGIAQNACATSCFQVESSSPSRGAHETGVRPPEGTPSKAAAAGPSPVSKAEERGR